jgi:hypothetical protein
VVGVINALTVADAGLACEETVTQGYPGKQSPQSESIGVGLITVGIAIVRCSEDADVVLFRLSPRILAVWM